MTNNDILKRIRFTFDFRDGQVVDMMRFANYEADIKDVTAWLKNEEDPTFLKMNDHKLAAFLNGLIVEKRGKKEGVEIKNEKQLNNNLILRKLKIALTLKSEDVVALLKLADFKMSESEVNAFFRDPSKDKYRECKDQVLRNFLMGMQLKYAKKNS